jgi:hypothetical protein
MNDKPHQIMKGGIMKRDNRYSIGLIFFLLAISLIMNSSIVFANRANVEAFVTRFYQQCLGRDPEPEGLNFYTDRLLSGQACGSEVAANFINSPEFVDKGTSDEEYLIVMYRAFFDREPDDDGWAYYLNKLNSGVNRDVVFKGFVYSPEFNNLCSAYGIIAFPNSIEIWVESSPVSPHTGPDFCFDVYPEWEYTIYVRAGTAGIRITENTTDFYDSDGNWLGQTVFSENDFANWFGSSYIGAESTVGSIMCTHLGGLSSGSIIDTYYGIDDNGNVVVGSVRIQLNPSQQLQSLELDRNIVEAPAVRGK